MTEQTPLYHVERSDAHMLTSVTCTSIIGSPDRSADQLSEWQDHELYMGSLISSPPALSAAAAAAQAHDVADSAACAAAAFASEADPNAIAIERFVRYGGVDSVDEARRVVRWLLVRGVLIEQRNVSAGGAATPFHRVLYASEGPMGPIGRVAAFLDVPLLSKILLTLSVARPPTSEGGFDSSYTVENMLAGTKVWLTKPIFAGRDAENVILRVADGSRVTSFELATNKLIGGTCEVSIESVDAGGNPLGTLVAWQSCGVGSFGGRPSTYTPKTFPVVTSATEFLITLRLRRIDMRLGHTAAGLAICHARGTPPRLRTKTSPPHRKHDVD